MQPALSPVSRDDIGNTDDTDNIDDKVVKGHQDDKADKDGKDESLRLAFQKKPFFRLNFEEKKKFFRLRHKKRQP